MMALKGKRIFYIEDNLSNRAIVQMIIEQNGGVFGFERWGREETIAKLKDFAPVDLILLDLMFPKHVSGYDVFDHIRTEPDFAHTPILAISASDPSVEIPKAQEKGFSGFIAKPVDLRLLPQQILACLSGETVWYAG